MIWAEVKDVSISDNVIPHDHSSERSSRYNVPIHLTIGVRGERGGDLFVMELCDLEWLQGQLAARPVLLPTTMVVCGDASLADVEENLSEKVSKISGQSWDEIVGKISQFAVWEFSK